MSGDKSDPALVAAQKLADILRQKRAFTNISTFDLKCLVGVAYLNIVCGFLICFIIIIEQDCGQGLVGEKGARAHAKETGHLKFGEY